MEFIRELLAEGKTVRNNPVAKHANTFNKAARMKDKKRSMKRGEKKHKNSDDE